MIFLGYLYIFINIIISYLSKIMGNVNRYFNLYEWVVKEMNKINLHG